MTSFRSLTTNQIFMDEYHSFCVCQRSTQIFSSVLIMATVSTTATVILICHLSLFWNLYESPTPPPPPKSEYDGWRGKAYLDDMDMVEIANWVKELNETRMDAALQYYWVNNEVMYSHAAMIHAMFAVFNETTKDQGFSRSFIFGVEIIVHYIILKSFPVVGRRGGIRGTGKDSAILRAGVAPLVACYQKVVPSQRFSLFVFPIKTSTTRRKRRALMKSRRPQRVQELKPKVARKPRSADSNESITEASVPEDPAPVELIWPEPEYLTVPIVPTSTPTSMWPDLDNNNVPEELPAPTPRSMWPDAENNLGSTRSDDWQDQQHLGRYTYGLSHGSLQRAKLTNIVLEDEDVNKLENIAVTIFWLVYELIPTLCSWTVGQITPYKESFDKILGLVLSMYIFDQADFAEEYERIFHLTQPQFEVEWGKVEQYAKSLKAKHKLQFTKPYSDLI